MDTAELRNKSQTELKDELRELLREQFSLRMQKATHGTDVKHTSFKQVRRAIARVKTILHEKVSQQ